MPLECFIRFRRVLAFAWSVALPLLASPTRAAENLTNQPAKGAPAPVVTYAVQRFDVVGNSALSDAQLQGALREAVGPKVDLKTIRASLVRLQEAYRANGYLSASLSLPKQALTNGVVQIRVQQGPGANSDNGGAPELAAFALAPYRLRHFEVRGNTALSAEALDKILSPLGDADAFETEIRAKLAQLQEAYRQAGYPQAVVKAPVQLVDGAPVVLEVSEGLALDAIDPAQKIAKAPVAPPPVRTFEVREYEVTGNTLLSANSIQSILTNYTGATVSVADIQKGLADLQQAYREHGFATVAVGLPQQRITNGLVKVQITEGSVVAVRVTGNQHFSSNNVMRALPSLSTNRQFNSKIFQSELDRANQNRDRQIYPSIGPGPEPGDSALTLRVKDRLPLHARAELNNNHTPQTPDWRIATSVQYNNLWQLEHNVGLAYGFSPEQFKSKGLVPNYLVNQPLIAYYGGYYSLPLAQPASIQELVDRSAGQFGYDEATRQFRLPPMANRPDLTFFVSGSTSDTGLKYGPETTVSQSPLLTILTQDSGQNLAVNEAVGLRFSTPLLVQPNSRLSASIGADVKRYELSSFNFNNIRNIRVITNILGSQTNIFRRTIKQAPRINEVVYAPITASLDYFRTDAQGQISASATASGNFAGSDGDFSALASSTNASATFGKVALSLQREQLLPQRWSVVARGSGQAASGALIGNEQFALGGTRSIRGYFEGDTYGDLGWQGGLEVRTPYLEKAMILPHGTTPLWLRGLAFVDAGQAFILESTSAAPSTRTLVGTGFGFTASLNNAFDIKLSVGWPLRDSGNTKAFDPRVYFSVGGQF